jgi:hypothetical protein
MARLEDDPKRSEVGAQQQEQPQEQPSSTTPQQSEGHPRRPQNFDDWSIRHRDDDPNN